MHNHDGKDDSWMMWVMMICCAAPLLLLILFGLGGKTVGTPAWIFMGGIAVMLVAHFFMMGRSHKHSDKEQIADGESKGNEGKTDHSGHGGCH